MLTTNNEALNTEKEHSFWNKTQLLECDEINNQHKLSKHVPELQEFQNTKNLVSLRNINIMSPFNPFPPMSANWHL